MWWKWLITGVLFAVSVVVAFLTLFKQLSGPLAGLSVVVMGVFEIIFLKANEAIDLYKYKQENQRFRLRGKNVLAGLHAAQSKELQQMLSIPPSEFLCVAQEISDLQRQKNESAGPQTGWLRSIYTSTAKERLMAIILGALAVIASLVIPTVDKETFIELSMSLAFWGDIAYLCLWACFFHFGLYSLKAVWLMLRGKALKWFLRFGWSQASAKKVALNYFVNALVQHHCPTTPQRKRYRPYPNCVDNLS